jgi:hypothetical protein
MGVFSCSYIGIEFFRETRGVTRIRSIRQQYVSIIIHARTSPILSKTIIIDYFGTRSISAQRNGSGNERGPRGKDSDRVVIREARRGSNSVAHRGVPIDPDIDARCIVRVQTATTRYMASCPFTPYFFPDPLFCILN